jgi:hypothetical protein
VRTGEPLLLTTGDADDVSERATHLFGRLLRFRAV